MKLIKIRWKDINGTTFYSHLEISCGCLCLCTASPPSYHGEIDEESVAQLVGYDMNGNEIYEGDKFKDKYGHIHTARLRPQGYCNDDKIRFDWMPESNEFCLLKGE